MGTTGVGSDTTGPEVDLIDHWIPLGRAVRRARLARGLTQQGLAESAKVSRAWLARVESGHRKAELDLVMRVLDTLGLVLAITPAPVRDIDPDLGEALRIAGLH